MIGATHNGKFHADDVFATVVIKTIFPKIKIIRTRDLEKINQADIAYDVGRICDPSVLRFDHHQNGAPMRSNGIAYSSFGLVWREFGEKYCESAKVAERIDQQLVQLIDADDNGIKVAESIIDDVSPFDTSGAIDSFNPSYLIEDEKLGDEYFWQAVDWAETLLKRLVKQAHAAEKSVEYIAHAVAKSTDERFVVLNRLALYDGISIDYPKLLFMVFPDDVNNTWQVLAMRKNSDSFESRKPFPVSWAGLDGKALAKVSGVADAVFCHKKRFLAVAKTKNGALGLMREALADE